MKNFSGNWKYYITFATLWRIMVAIIISFSDVFNYNNSSSLYLLIKNYPSLFYFMRIFMSHHNFPLFCLRNFYRYCLCIQKSSISKWLCLQWVSRNSIWLGENTINSPAVVLKLLSMLKTIDIVYPVRLIILTVGQAQPLHPVGHIRERNLHLNCIRSFIHRLGDSRATSRRYCPRSRLYTSHEIKPERLA